MSRDALPRIVTPLALAAAILVSFGLEKPAPPVELASEEPPAPAAAEVRGAFEEALSAAGPGYDRGVGSATVTVLEFSDFGCPYCARFATATYPRLAEAFVKTGKVRWKYVPFVMGMFPNGGEAARAAECAADQGRTAFGRMHDLLYQRQDEWKGASDPAALFRGYAGRAAMNVDRFASCYASDATQARIRASNELADRMGVRATPTFFVNGERIEGALSADQFREVLLDALGGAGGGAGR